MDADSLLRQGKELADKLRQGAGEQVAQHEHKIKETIGKVADFVNSKTEGRYAEQVGKAASFVEQGVDRLAAEAPAKKTPDEAPSGGGGPSAFTTAGPASPPEGASATGAPGPEPAPGTPPAPEASESPATSETAQTSGSPGTTPDTSEPTTTEKKDLPPTR